MNNKYEDIIKLNRPESNHKKMSIESRAGQFAPFAALTGYNDEINEAKRMTKEKIELDDEMKTIINNKLQLIINNIKNKPNVTITYFEKDKKKNGGNYIKITDYIKKIDEIYKIIYLSKRKISICEIIDIDIK